MIVVAYDPGANSSVFFVTESPVHLTTWHQPWSTWEVLPFLVWQPIIDIDVPLVSGVTLPEASERRAGIGYVHQGILRTAERQAFCAPVNDPHHHLYLCPPDSAEFRRHIAFRDYLRFRPERCQGPTRT
jgi:GrpB-like predicted nucleotidyltransferase (UPF0157 family)